MTGVRVIEHATVDESQSAFMRGFIDDLPRPSRARSPARKSQSAFMRGFIDDDDYYHLDLEGFWVSQSAFMRGFIDDGRGPQQRDVCRGLNPRSCAASSMTAELRNALAASRTSQSAFMRGFIDDGAV